MVFSTHQDGFANFRGKKKFLEFKLIAAGKKGRRSGFTPPAECWTK